MSDNEKRRTVIEPPTPRPNGEDQGKQISLPTVPHRRRAAPPGDLAWVPAPDSIPPAPDSSPAAPDSSSEDSLPAPGERIGEYEILRKLGSGGMGVVFLARDTKLGRKVAIKFLHNNAEPKDEERFLREARATARCGDHDNIVIIHEVKEEYPCMVLEYLDGGPLTRLLPKGQRLPPARAIELIVPVVRALKHTHERGLVHRDLKLDNIFLTRKGIIKVLDFGLAKPLEGEFGRGTKPMTAVMTAVNPDGIELTRRGTAMGTLFYMSPEQWRGAVEVDHQTDVFAIGAILARMLAGDHLLAALSEEELERFMMLLELPMPSIRAVCPDVPDALADIITGCLKKHKEQRIESASELLKALELLLPGRERRLRDDECPYAGLNAFQEADAAKYFGRTGDVSAVIARLRDTPLLSIVGPSGVGKSSLVRAGIIPALDASVWSIVVIRPGREPISATAKGLTTLLVSHDAETTANTAITDVTGSGELSQEQEMVKLLRGEAGYLGTMLGLQARFHGRHILVFVDQFEELYTQADPVDRAAFLAALAGIVYDATSPLRVVLSIRSDFLDRIAEDEALAAELTRGLFFLRQPTRDGLRDALIEPATMAGYRFDDPALVEAMLDDLAHTPGALPLLSFAAAQLWERRDRARRLLTVESYQRIGGIAGVLASHADAVVAECAPHEQALVRALMLRLVTPERTRALVPVAELSELSPDPSELHRAINRLMHARLVVSQSLPSESGGTVARGSIELVHESLIHAWPLLRRWLDETPADSAVLEQIRQAAKQWEAKGRSQDLLWRGEAADEARRWRSRFRGELTELQRAYLDAVHALATRTARRKRGAFIAAVIVLVLIAGGATAGFVIVREARDVATAERNTATIERAKTVDANTKLESKNAALLAAVDAATKARTDSERARTEAERASAAAEEARIRAEDAQRLEGVSKRRATAAAKKAIAAEADARRAGERLEIQLATERQRVKELEAHMEGVTIVPSVKKPNRGDK